MLSKRKCSTAIAVASAIAASGIFYSTAHAKQTIGAWNGTNTNFNPEGFFDWEDSDGGFGTTTVPADENNPGALPWHNNAELPASQYSASTVGATLGTASLANKPYTYGGFTQTLSVKTQYETDSQGNSEIQDVVNNKYFEINVTYNSAQWNANTTYVNTYAVFNFSNASGSKAGFITLSPNNNPSTADWGYPAWDTANPNYPGGWDPTDYPGVTTRTLIWDYSDYVPATYSDHVTNTTVDNTSDYTIAELMGTNPSYAEFVLGDITDGSGGTFYYSDAAFTSPQINATWTAQAGANSDGTYHWGTLANWTPNGTGANPTGGMPSNPGDSVYFGYQNIPAGITETVALDGTLEFQISVGTINFDTGVGAGTSTYLIEAGTVASPYDVLNLNGDVTDYNYNQTFGKSTMTTVNGSAYINDEAGNDTISAPVNLATNATLAIAANSTLTISGNIGGVTGTGITLNSDTSATMAGTVVFSGVNTYSGGTTIDGGTLNIAAAGALPSSGAITINSGGTLLASVAGAIPAEAGAPLAINAGGTFISEVTGALPSGYSLTNNGTADIYGTQTLGASGVTALSGTGNLVVGNGTTPNVVHLAIGSGAATQGGLTINAHSSLDLGNNHMILSDPGGSIDATIESYLAAGYNGGGWNGTSANGGAIITSASTGTTYGIGWADGATGGISGISSGQLEIKYTLYGDTNLDGVVTGVDFGNLAANFGKSGANIGWAQGAFTYNNSVTGVDFGLLAGNFGKSLGSAGDVVTAADWAALDAFAEANGLMSYVPEPASTAMILMLATGALGYRRRRRQT